MIVIGSTAEVWPARMVTLAGTVSRFVSLEARLTTRGLAKAVGMVTVPSTVPTPSVALAGTVTVKGGKTLTAKATDSVAEFRGDPVSTTVTGKL